MVYGVAITESFQHCYCCRFWLLHSGNVWVSFRRRNWWCSYYPFDEIPLSHKGCIKFCSLNAFRDQKQEKTCLWFLLFLLALCLKSSPPLFQRVPDRFRYVFLWQKIPEEKIPQIPSPWAHVPCNPAPSAVPGGYYSWLNGIPNYSFLQGLHLGHCPLLLPCPCPEQRAVPWPAKFNEVSVNLQDNIFYGAFLEGNS